MIDLGIYYQVSDPNRALVDPGQGPRPFDLE